MEKKGKRNAVTGIYLFLGNKCGALTVHGVVGEVIRECFSSIPHRISCDAIRDLWKSEHKILKDAFSA